MNPREQASATFEIAFQNVLNVFEACISLQKKLTYSWQNQMYIT